VVCTVDDDRFLHRVFEVVSDAITKHGPQVGGRPQRKGRRNANETARSNR
jgi:hypothetical protein